MSDAHGVARDQLRAFIERIERLEEEKKTIADDIKDVYGEAKGMGYDTKIMKMVISLRKKDEQERTEQELILDTYLAALGMIPDFEPDPDPAPVDPKPTKSPAMALQSPRQAPVTASERIVALLPIAEHPASHGEKTVRPESAASSVEEIAAPIQPETATKSLGDGDCSTVEQNGTATAGTAVTAGETATIQPETANDLNRPAPLAVSGGEPGTPSSDAGGEKTEEASQPSSGRSDVTSGDKHAQSEQATTDQPPAGGSHVDPDQHAATHQAGPELLIEPRPVAFILRPNCLNRDMCAGHGSNHCHRCTVALREAVAA
jgi:uncharacterized protein (UPF0335 family)